MSGNLQCHSCEKTIQPNWKYCRFCGIKLQNVVTSTKISDNTEINPDTTKKVEFDRDTYFKVLSTRAQRSALAVRKKELGNEISSLLEQLQSGLIKRDYAMPKITELKNEVKKVTTEQEKFADLPEELPYEVLSDQYEAAKERIKKIEDLKSDKDLSKDTIREAKVRAMDSLELLQNQISQVQGYIRSWQADLKKNLETQRKEIEFLYVRFKTGEITEASYNEKKKDKVNEVTILQDVVDMLERMLD